MSQPLKELEKTLSSEIQFNVLIGIKLTEKFILILLTLIFIKNIKMTEDIRWEQRFSNYNKALYKLSQAVTQAGIKKLSELEVEGLIQRFEYTYELAWKTLQDLIKQLGLTDINGPSQVLTQAFQFGLINNAEGWRRLKKSRELTSHTYDTETAQLIAEAIIKEYFDLFKFLQEKLENQKNGEKGDLIL